MRAFRALAVLLVTPFTIPTFLISIDRSIHIKKGKSNKIEKGFVISPTNTYMLTLETAAQSAQAAQAAQATAAKAQSAQATAAKAQSAQATAAEWAEAAKPGAAEGRRKAINAREPRTER
jgi:uncharacterized membrane protein YdbT with pleckstrin-like domain